MENQEVKQESKGMLEALAALFDRSRTKESLQITWNTNAAIAGACFIALITFLQMDKPSGAVNFAAVCFALCLPTMVAELVKIDALLIVRREVLFACRCPGYKIVVPC